MHNEQESKYDLGQILGVTVSGLKELPLLARMGFLLRIRPKKGNLPFSRQIPTVTELRGVYLLIMIRRLTSQGLTPSFQMNLARWMHERLLKSLIFRYVPAMPLNFDRRLYFGVEVQTLTLNQHSRDQFDRYDQEAMA